MVSEANVSISPLKTHPLQKAGVPCAAFKADRLSVFIYPNRDLAGQADAIALEKNVYASLRRTGSFGMILAAAPSQDDAYRYAVNSPTFPWQLSRANFPMDEYHDLLPSDKRAFKYYHDTHVWGPLLSQGRGIRFDRIHQFDTQAADKELEVLCMSSLLHLWKPNIVQGGIGEGEHPHIAFDDFGIADFHDPLLVKTIELALVAKQQQVGEGHFPRIEDVPMAYTLTIPALTQWADFWACIAPTAAKAEAAYYTAFGVISEEVPAAILRTLPKAALFLTLDSGSLFEERVKPYGISFDALRAYGADSGATRPDRIVAPQRPSNYRDGEGPANTGKSGGSRTPLRGSDMG